MFSLNFANFCKQIKFERFPPPSPPPPKKKNKQAMNSALEFHFPALGTFGVSVTGMAICFPTLVSKGVLLSLILSSQQGHWQKSVWHCHDPAPKAAPLPEGNRISRNNGDSLSKENSSHWAALCVRPRGTNLDFKWRCVWVRDSLLRKAGITETQKGKKGFKNQPLLLRSKSINMLVRFLPVFLFMGYHRLLQSYYRHE